MILYVTKETFERYKLKMPHEMDSPIAKTISKAVIEKNRRLAYGVGRQVVLF